MSKKVKKSVLVVSGTVNAVAIGLNVSKSKARQALAKYTTNGSLQPLLPEPPHILG